MSDFDPINDSFVKHGDEEEYFPILLETKQYVLDFLNLNGGTVVEDPSTN